MPDLRRPLLASVAERPFQHTEVRLFPKSSVLIVDRSAESREVLKTALERRGMRIFEAAGAEAGLKLAQENRLDLIILDLDASESSEAAPEANSSGEIVSIPISTRPIRLSAADFAAARHDSAAPTPLVLLGVARRRDNMPSERARQFVAKPYHYGPLILKIEQMLKKGIE